MGPAWLTAISCEPGDGHRAVIEAQTSIKSLLGVGSRTSEDAAVYIVDIEAY